MTTVRGVVAPTIGSVDRLGGTLMAPTMKHAEALTAVSLQASFEENDDPRRPPGSPGSAS